MMDLIQACIFVLGGAAIWLVGRSDARIRRWGYVVGLISQPFWFYAAGTTGQWGMTLLSAWYLYAWLDGLIRHWRVK